MKYNELSAIELDELIIFINDNYAKKIASKSSNHNNIQHNKNVIYCPKCGNKMESLDDWQAYAYKSIQCKQCKNEIDMVFLMRHFKYMDISHWVTGTDQKKLNKDNLASIPIMIPPIDLQQRYAVLVEQHDKSKYLNPVHYMRGRKRR
jgi:hypothetical protein